VKVVFRTEAQTVVEGQEVGMEEIDMDAVMVELFIMVAVVAELKVKEIQLVEVLGTFLESKLTKLKMRITMTMILNMISVLRRTINLLMM